MPPRALVNRGYGLGRFMADGTEAERTIRETADVLARLFDDPGVGPEAMLRRAVMRVLADQADAAIGDLDRLMASPDTFLRYLAHMMRGVIHDRAGELADAVSQFRRAADIVPAPSAMTSLAATLHRQGRGAEAVQVLAALGRDTTVADPWRTYGDRDYRLFPGLLDQMRALVVR